jgi:hypothetical protein
LALGECGQAGRFAGQADMGAQAAHLEMRGLIRAFAACGQRLAIPSRSFLVLSLYNSDSRHKNCFHVCRHDCHEF